MVSEGAQPCVLSGLEHALHFLDPVYIFAGLLHRAETGSHRASLPSQTVAGDKSDRLSWLAGARDCPRNVLRCTYKSTAKAHLRFRFWAALDLPIWLLCCLQLNGIRVFMDTIPSISVFSHSHGLFEASICRCGTAVCL